MNAVLLFLKKYWLRIFLFGVLSLLFLYLIPLIEQDYLRIDSDTLDHYATVTTISLIVLVAVTILFLAFRRSKNFKGLTNAVLMTIYYGFCFFLLVKPIVYVAVLSLNKIQHKQFEKKYIISALESNDTIMSIYDIEQKKSVITDHLKQISGLSGMRWGDTIVISFNRGLLGVNYKPMSLKTLLARPQNVPVTAFRIRDNDDSTYWYDVKWVHNQRNNAYINIYSNKDGRLVLGKQFLVICKIADTLEPIWINKLQEHIKGFDGERIILKRGRGEDSCWMQ